MTSHLKILALDTSTEACSAALLYNDEIIARYEIAPRQHSRLILPMLQAVLTEAGVDLSQLDAVAFGCGPGSFTGVRIATSIAQGIAFAKDLPVLPISTLRALAQGASRELKAQQVLATIDARMNEIYWGLFNSINQNFMAALGAEIVCAPEQLLLPPNLTGKVVGVGSGWDSYGEVLSAKAGNHLQEWVAHRYPSAWDIALLAAEDYKQGKMVSAEQALPVYLRDEVVKL